MAFSTADGSLLKEVSQPQVYVMCGGARVWIPTPDALAHLGYDFGQVQVVPDGALGAIPVVVLPSLSPTPASMVFPMGRPYGHTNKWVPRTDLPGVSLPNGNHVGAVRGQLINVPGNPAPGQSIVNETDPDMTMLLLPAASCLDDPALGRTTLIKVGDILDSDVRLNAVDPPITTHRAWVATPRFKIEVCGYPAKNVHTPGTCPADWSVYPSTVDAWPFWPPNLAGLDRKAVVVSGTLVADEPHTQSGGADYRVAAVDWQGGPDDDVRYLPGNPARYTEVHPPDSITLDNGAAETGELVGVAVSMGVSGATPFPMSQELNVTISAAMPQPPGTTLRVEEIVLPASYLPSMTYGNPTMTGAELTVWESSFHVRVEVTAAPFNQHTGRFAAVYRLSWAAKGKDAKDHKDKEKEAHTDKIADLEKHTDSAGRLTTELAGPGQIGPFVGGQQSAGESSTFIQPAERPDVEPR